jgi:hypothetical protein
MSREPKLSIASARPYRMVIIGSERLRQNPTANKRTDIFKTDGATTK